jgi:hypothetical protein
VVDEKAAVRRPEVVQRERLGLLRRDASDRAGSGRRHAAGARNREDGGELPEKYSVGRSM